MERPQYKSFLEVLKFKLKSDIDGIEIYTHKKYPTVTLDKEFLQIEGMPRSIPFEIAGYDYTDLMYFLKNPTPK